MREKLLSGKLTEQRAHMKAKFYEVLVDRYLWRAVRFLMPCPNKMELGRNLCVSIRSFEATCWDHFYRGMYAYAAGSFLLRELSTRIDKE